LPWTTPTLAPVVLTDALEEEFPEETLVPPAELELEPESPEPWLCASAGPAKASTASALSAITRNFMDYPLEASLDP
jgi:hypothetical protein